MLKHLSVSPYLMDQCLDSAIESEPVSPDGIVSFGSEGSNSPLRLQAVSPSSLTVLIPDETPSVDVTSRSQMSAHIIKGCSIFSNLFLGILLIIFFTDRSDELLPQLLAGAYMLTAAAEDMYVLNNIRMINEAMTMPQVANSIAKGFSNQAVILGRAFHFSPGLDAAGQLISDFGFLLGATRSGVVGAWTYKKLSKTVQFLKENAPLSEEVRTVIRKLRIRRKILAVATASSTLVILGGLLPYYFVDDKETKAKLTLVQDVGYLLQAITTIVKCAVSSELVSLDAKLSTFLNQVERERAVRLNPFRGESVV